MRTWRPRRCASEWTDRVAPDKDGLITIRVSTRSVRSMRRELYWISTQA
ncbi:hypothetical protein GOB98_24125 [Sinorhizobium meliloti]|nr:hypothetical protein [Sinorhizobium meliloti]MDE3820138.1 hypothetical protein [Sinorhizobium meliloti]MDW9973038.1 hypothetical protein [Sinorhizobium meliloti]MDW9979114.1 hypothetical protein [Sinorhizobium meliloti]MDX0295720.1 hypothetical protein [Sinorhizobium meliloti]